MTKVYDSNIPNLLTTELQRTTKLVDVAGVSCYGNTCFMQDCSSVTTTDGKLLY